MKIEKRLFEHSASHPILLMAVILLISTRSMATENRIYINAITNKTLSANGMVPGARIQVKKTDSLSGGTWVATTNTTANEAGYIQVNIPSYQTEAHVFFRLVEESTSEFFTPVDWSRIPCDWSCIRPTKPYRSQSAI